MLFLCGVDLKSNQKAFFHHCNILCYYCTHGDIFHTGHCGSEGSQLGKLLLTSSLQPTLAPSDTVKAIWQGRSFLVSTYLISPCPVSKICEILTNSVLPSSSGAQPRQGAITYVFVVVRLFWRGVSLVTCDQQHDVPGSGVCQHKASGRSIILCVG